MGLRAALLPILLILVVAAVVSYIVLDGSARPASAEELVQSADAERERLLTVLEAGGVLTVEVETYQRGRSTAPQIPGVISLPDRAIEVSTFEVGADGVAQPGDGAIRGTDGALIATFHHDGSTRVFVDASTGAETRFPLPFATLEVDLAEWIVYALQDPAERLMASGMEEDGAGEFLGETSTRFRRTLTLEGQRSVREEYEFLNDNPFLARYSVYEPDGDGEVLVRETITRAITATGR